MRSLATIAVLAAACQSGRLAPTATTPRDAGASTKRDAAVADGGGHHITPTADCSLTKVPDDPTAARDALVDAAEQAYEGEHYDVAWTCADRAADLDPRSVAAQHLRAASWAALGDFADAQDAFSLALALDPDDVELLRAAADFYLHQRGEVSDDAVAVALALAERGVAGTKRDSSLTDVYADLYALVAEADDDLGRSAEALVAAGRALALVPDQVDAAHERALALFDLERFVDADAAYRKLIAADDKDAGAHDGLGLTLEWEGQATGAAERARATALDPEDFPAPVAISAAEFRAEAEADGAHLDAASRALLAQVVLETPDRPALDDLAGADPVFPPSILGLYRGAPVTETPQAGDPPRAIVLYRMNLVDAVRTRAELSREIDKTLRHELAHAAGDDEDQVRRRGLE